MSESEDPKQTQEERIAIIKQNVQKTVDKISAIPAAQRTPFQVALLTQLTELLKSLNSPSIKNMLSGTKTETEEAPEEKKEEEENPEGGRRKRKSRRRQRKRSTRRRR